MFGGRERGRVPVKTLQHITLSDPANGLDPVQLPCQVRGQLRGMCRQGAIDEM